MRPISPIEMATEVIPEATSSTPDWFIQDVNQAINAKWNGKRAIITLADLPFEPNNEDWTESLPLLEFREFVKAGWLVRCLPVLVPSRRKPVLAWEFSRKETPRATRTPRQPMPTQPTTPVAPPTDEQPSLFNVTQGLLTGTESQTTDQE